MHTEEASNLIRYRVTVEMNCPDCGGKISECIPNTRNKVDSLAIKCQKCSSSHLVKPRNESYLRIYNSTSTARDPIFNLPLWLQAEIKNDVLWAYNRSHLTDIKAYVQADLRERQTTTHTTMVERLPGFIKKAKNRLSILKAIVQLEHKL
jgi:DNA-directed RNA polymerase subunit RPC12/RpoP